MARASFIMIGRSVISFNYCICLWNHVDPENSNGKPIRWYKWPDCCYQSYKPANLENGVRILVPPFISAGERVIVDTNELTYLRRAD